MKPRPKSLKTLKDLNLRQKFDSQEWNLIRMKFFQIEEDLRAEAVKWIKELKQNPNAHNEIFTEWHEGDTKPEGRITINWIKHFFNITEEDLKSGQGDE